VVNKNVSNKNLKIITCWSDEKVFISWSGASTNFASGENINLK
jgi:hypothetical protein